MKERSAFIAIIGLLAVALFAGWLMMSKRQRATDEQRIANVKSDLKRLEDRINNELRGIEDGTFTFSSNDSVKNELVRVADQINKDRREILNDEKKATTKVGDFEGKIAKYDEFLSGTTSERDRKTGGFIASLQEELRKTKARVEELMGKNRALSGQLAKTIKQFKGARQELDKMKAEKARVDRILQDQSRLQDSLSTSLSSNAAELKQQLIAAQQRLNSQEAEIARLRGMSMKALDFKAYYVISRLGNDRVVLLDEKTLMKHKNSDIEKMFVEFRVNDVFFDDGQDKKFELTMYRNGQPYKLIREPIIVGNTNQKTMFYMFDGKNKLETGSYFLRLTYGDEAVTPDYKFVVQ
jgi:multidrug efflux pump subunit AcrA (membrane-fusion protein)